MTNPKLVMDGENGKFYFDLESGANSRIGDMFLGACDADFHGALGGLCIRAPMIGGGASPHIYDALLQMLGRKPVEKNPAKADDADHLRRKRKRVMCIGDDMDDSSGLSYLELESDKEGFTLCMTNVAIRGSVSKTTSGPIRFTDDASMERLSQLYNGMERDQKAMKKRLTAYIEAGRSYFYSALGPEQWDENLVEETSHLARYRRDYQGKELAKQENFLEAALYNSMREVGIFLLKFGVPLPAESRERWVEKFGAEPEVAALLAPKRTR